MLVLSRRVGESFVIGNDILVTVVQVSSHGVRLGIEAGSGTEIVRGELENAARPADTREVESKE